jgi:hypothetical protein
MSRLSTLVCVVLGAVVVLTSAVVLWPRSPHSQVSALLLGDALLIALSITLATLAVRTKRAKPVTWPVWVACGALVGAAAAGPLRVALWLLPASLALAAAGVLSGVGGLAGALRRLGLVLAAALVNFVLLWSATMADVQRPTAAEFQAKDFRVNTFLAEVPLLDVWVFNLRGGDEGLTVQDARAVLGSQSPFDANTAVAVLVAIRMSLGGMLGWDDEEHFDTTSSYINRLTDDDRMRTTDEPGVGQGMFRTLYTFDNESLAEMMNRTAHAFFCMAMEPAGDGYRMYWAIYVRQTCALTPAYMGVITPFRRHIVYPAIVHSVERTWAARWAEPPG